MTACDPGASDRPPPVVCPPVVAYDIEFQARAAEEIDRFLPEGLAVMELLSDYAVMREQARACAG